MNVVEIYEQYLNVFNSMIWFASITPKHSSLSTIGGFFLESITTTSQNAEYCIVIDATATYGHSANATIVEVIIYLRSPPFFYK